LQIDWEEIEKNVSKARSHTNTNRCETYLRNFAYTHTHTHSWRIIKNNK